MARSTTKDPDLEAPQSPDPSMIDGLATAKNAIAVFDPEFAILNLHQKIAHISGYVGAVPKRGYNSFHKYHYVTEADLVSVLRQYLAAAGIVIVPNAHKWEFHGEICMVDVEYTVTDGNEAFTFSMPGAGADRGDKGVYKAVTGSQKYALMKLFKIETGDDPESDTRVDERASQPDAKAVTIRTGERGSVQRGGHTTNASAIQIRRINELAKDLDLDRPELATLLSLATNKEFILPGDEGEQGPAVLAFIRSLTAEEAGQVIEAMVDRITDRPQHDDQGGGYG